MKPKINDVVRLICDMLGESLQAGALRVVVEEHSYPEEAYEIEFSSENGKTIAQLALLPNQFVLIAV
ncbi:DUF4926 domain-containing protein [Mesorhizobium sp. M0701]|uniref:DUF4926 domain-containing protein n=1 Tax=Mesorhizobium sp. M0701 TaxID=2956989 RepID=UPI003339A56E